MSLITSTLAGLRATRRQYALYLTVAALTGLFMNGFGHWAQLGWFKHWWQVFTCYWGWMVPFALLLRGRPWHVQYAYGVVAMIPLEMVGYALKSTVAAPDHINLVARILTPHNVALAMVAFFAVFFPLGNRLIAFLDRVLPGAPARPGATPEAPR